MKSIITTLSFISVLAVGSMASALTAQDSWETILNSRHIQTQAATVAFEAGDAKTYVSVLEVCALNDEQFMTKEPQNIWKVTRINNNTQHEVIGQQRLVGSNKTVSYIKSAASTSPTYTAIERTIEKTQNIDVMYKVVGSSSSPTKLFTKSFTIPNCQQ